MAKRLAYRGVAKQVAVKQDMRTQSHCPVPSTQGQAACRGDGGSGSRIMRTRE